MKLRFKLDQEAIIMSSVLLFAAGFNFVCYYKCSGWDLNLYCAWCSVIGSGMLLCATCAERK